MNRHAAEAKVINPCDDNRGHFWRPVNDKVSQCARCGECATAADFAEQSAPASPQETPK